jgi:leucyl-tRNA synthetase
VFLADYVLMGYGTGAIMAVPAHDERDLAFAREFGLPVTEVVSPPDQEDPVEAAIAWLEHSGHGHRQRTYRLRDWLFSRQRYWGEPFPIVYDSLGMPRALPEDLLPVMLPEMTEFGAGPPDGRTGDPLPPLARASDWAEVELDLGDGRRTYRRELNTMPQWAGSCWYYLRYLDPDNDTAFVDPQIERYWMSPPGAAPGDGGVDLYVGGAEHAVLHLLYARFWHKVLFDLGHVSTREPFRRLLNQGYILADAFTDARGRYVPAAEVGLLPDGTPARDGEPVTRRAGKMGKSLKNGISPDEMYARYGADTLRLYEMAMGPLDGDRPWQTDDVVGVYRFLQRLWRSLVDERTGDLIVDDGPLDDETARLLHRTVSAVRGHYAALRFNVAIARLQELTSHASRIAAAGGAVPRSLAEPLVLMVAPLAPHIAEELWARLGHGESVSKAAFPEADEALAAEPAVVVPVQVNGRVRFRIEVPSGCQRGADPADPDQPSGLRPACRRTPSSSASYGRLGVHRQDPVAGPQPLAPVKPLVQVEDDRCLGFEVRVAGEIHDWYCQGLTGCSARIRSTEDAESWPAGPALVSSASSSGPVQRDSGTPVAAGSWQASATTAARSAR